MTSRNGTGRASGADDGDAVPADSSALDHLFSVTYEELRRLAASVQPGRPERHAEPHRAGERGVAQAGRQPAPRRHLAAPLQADCRPRHAPGADRGGAAAARRQAGRRRRGRHVRRVARGRRPAPDDLLELDAALEELARLSPRQAQLVESRFFGGLDVAEAAQLLGVSEATALRDWRAAKAWLARELRDGRQPGGRYRRGEVGTGPAALSRRGRAAGGGASARSWMRPAPTTRHSIAEVLSLLAGRRRRPRAARSRPGRRRAARCSTAGCRRHCAPCSSGPTASRACSARAAWASSTSPSATTSPASRRIKILRDAWLSPARRERFASRAAHAGPAQPSLHRAPLRRQLASRRDAVVRHGVRGGRAAHRVLPGARRRRWRSGSACSAPCARRCSTRTRTPSSTATSSRRTSS